MPKIQRLKRTKRPASPTDIQLPTSFKDEAPDFDSLSFASTDLVSASQIGSKIAFTPGGKVSSQSIILEPGCLSSDGEAAHQFIQLHGPENFVVCNDILWVFNTQNGMWTQNMDHIHKMISRLGQRLTICETKEKKKSGKTGDDGSETVISKVYQYAIVSNLTKGLLIKLPHFVETNDSWERDKFGSDRFKVLFTNGFYDFQTKQFNPDADSSIVFTSGCSQRFDFSSRNEEDIRRVREVFFDGMGDKDSSDTLLHELMRAFVGDFTRKKVIFGLGPTNSGKSGMMKFIMYCLGPLAGTFNGDSILQRRDGCEAARENSWIVDIADRRVAFSSEIKVPLDEASAKTCAINGNMLKRAASGGADVINARGAYGRERNYINKSALFIFANDLPRINPADDAIRERTIVVEWKYSYVDNPVEEFERKRDENIVNGMMKQKYALAFVWLMIDEFEKWRQDGFTNPSIKEVCLRGRDEIAPVSNVREILEEKYLITKKPDDYVIGKELTAYLRENGMSGSETKLGRELTNIGLKNEQKKINGKREKIRIGIKLRPEHDETHIDVD